MRVVLLLLIFVTSEVSSIFINIYFGTVESMLHKIISFSNESVVQEEEHIAQQSRRDKLRLLGFDPLPPSLVASAQPMNMQPVYHHDHPAAEAGAGATGGGMWSNMYNLPHGCLTGATDNIMETQMAASYHRPPADWYGERGVVVGVGPSTSNHQQPGTNLRDNHITQLSGTPTSLNADSAAAMQLFLMNPNQQHQTSSPSPQYPLSSHFTWGGGDTIQFNTSTNTGYNSPSTSHSTSGTLIRGGTVDRGLSLTLSSRLEAAKTEDMKMSDDGVMYFDQGGLSRLQVHPEQNLGIRMSMGMMNFLRNCKYMKAAQDLLEEFCSVGRVSHVKNKTARLPNPSDSGSSSKEVVHLPLLSSAEKAEYQRKKTRLLAMLDEVDRRYSHYCEQMQIVVNSFDTVMGFGSATPYTSLAQKAMSRHFRCLKDCITAQLKQTSELRGDKDVAGLSGVTKGETPRLRVLEQTLRQQRSFQHMGMMDQEAWRPQRGLPERSVNILRAWLFEHFLHPYPSDADKHLLARQTGLSRNQIANWFINARVRLWKPMVEEMYQREAKEQEGEEDVHVASEEEDHVDVETQQTQLGQINTSPTGRTSKRSQINAMDNDSSLNAINSHHHQFPSVNPVPLPPSNFLHDEEASTGVSPHFPLSTDEPDMLASTLLRYGTNMSDVSLTLGLQHPGINMPDKSQFPARDYFD